jgi:homoserine O-acetyltransferase
MHGRGVARDETYLHFRFFSVTSVSSVARFLSLALFFAVAAQAAPYPEPVQADFVIRNFRFAGGETLPELSLHYFTMGTPNRDDRGRITNAVLLLHGTGGRGAGFLTDAFAGELFGSGQALDAGRWFIIVPDNLGHGGSSKPSDDLRAKFPHYGYADMVEAQYRLVEEGLGVDHLRLVVGTSMGGMHAWMWAVQRPGFMDAVLPSPACRCRYRAAIAWSAG